MLLSAFVRIAGERLIELVCLDATGAFSGVGTAVHNRQIAVLDRVGSMSRVGLFVKGR